MTVSVACKCGRKFAVQDEMAGKRAKCPECGTVLQIPQQVPQKIGVSCECGKKFAAPGNLAGKAVKCPGCGNAVAIPAAPSESSEKQGAAEDLDRFGSGIGELLNEIGFDKKLTEHCCPNCRSHMGPGDIICINCGYNLETGKQIATKTIRRRTPGSAPAPGTKKGNSKDADNDNIAKAMIWPAVWLVLGIVVFVALGQVDPKSVESSLPGPLFAIYQSFGRLGGAVLCLVIGLVWGFYDFSRLKKS